MIGGFARFAARTFFRHIVIEGEQHLPAEGAVIFTPNHPNGLLDPMLLFFLSPPFRLRYVAKAPLFKIPVFGTILRAIGAIPVVRKFEAGGEVDYSAFFSSCVEALSKGDSIVIFPEGRSLPQSYLAPLKTGPARLFLMARKKGIPVQIVPVGLNYEKGTTFRSRVLVSIAPPLETAGIEDKKEPAAIRELTDFLKGSLEQHVVQTESYRERELMLLLERLSGDETSEHSEFKRFSRLKAFEHGLAHLRLSAADEIEKLAGLLSRYDRLSRNYGLDAGAGSTPFSYKTLLAVTGFLLAMPGWIFNFIPYHLCDLLIRTTRKDASDTATYKVVYSLFLFPAAYAFEGYWIHQYFGIIFLLLFALTILPLSYFTLHYFEWYEKHFGGMLWPGSRHRMKLQLERLQHRILQHLEKLRIL